MKMNSIGVVGCGTMGSGIAQVCAQSGYDVTVSEINQHLLDKGLASINSRLAKGVEKGNLSQQNKDSIIGKIKGTTNTGDFNDSDLVIEAAVEDIEMKKRVFSELDDICPDHTILATNTSCLSIIDIATATRRPENVLGLHFFNPVPVMSLLEVVPTLITRQDIIEAGVEFGQSLSKEIVIAKDTPGFIVNRLVLPFILSAIRMLENDNASREDIDKAIKLGLNYPIGPLALADLIGLDVVYNVVNAIYQDLKDPQFVPPVLLQKMCVARWLGRKTGKGFYDYE